MNPETLANPYEPHFDTLPFPAQLAVGRYLDSIGFFIFPVPEGPMTQG